MRFHFRTVLTAAGLLAAAAVPSSAQGPTIVADVVRAIGQVETKVMALANAMPENTYAWKPAGARSVSEVFQHIAADNYFLATPFGTMVPASTGINPSDYNTVVAYETRKLTRTEVIADLGKSFAHVKNALSNVTEASLKESASMFGQTFTKQQVLLITLTHLHEHLGQMIAYARTNNIVPPWSR